MKDHPDRPQPPAKRIPLTGDDNAPFQAWWNACDACRYSSKKYGCTEAGIIEYESGAKRGAGSCVRGGCRRWTPRPTQPPAPTLPP